MIDGINRFRKIQKDTYGGFMLVNCRRDFIKQMNYKRIRMCVKCDMFTSDLISETTGPITGK